MLAGELRQDEVFERAADDYERVVLLRQLRELPDARSGMSFTDGLILQILAEGASVTLNKLFWTLLKREPLSFIGDAGVARVVREMERAVDSSK